MTDTNMTDTNTLAVVMVVCRRIVENACVLNGMKKI